MLLKCRRDRSSKASVEEYIFRRVVWKLGANTGRVELGWIVEYRRGATCHAWCISRAPVVCQAVVLASRFRRRDSPDLRPMLR